MPSSFSLSLVSARNVRSWIVLLGLLAFAFTAQAEPTLIGGFSNSGDGTFVDADWSNGMEDIRVHGHPVVAAIRAPGLDGPSVAGHVATWTAGDLTLTLHDNAFGWMVVTGTGALDLEPAPGATLHETPRGPEWRWPNQSLVFRGDGAMWQQTENGLHVEVRESTAFMATEEGIFRGGAAPGAWALLEGGAEDWLRIDAAPFRVVEVGNETLILDAVGYVDDGATPDQWIRLDSMGIFADDDGLSVAHGGTTYERGIDTSAERKRPGFEAHGSEPATHWIRQSAGHSGELTLTRDGSPPTAELQWFGLDPYDPLHGAPQLVVTAGEPVTGTLTVGEAYEKPTLQRAYELRFRLTGLDPSTEYPYRLVLLDAAGNSAEFTGSFTTGAGQSTVPMLATTQSLEDGTHKVWIWGASLPEGTHLRAFLDDAPTDASWDGRNGTWTGSVGDGERLRFEVWLDSGLVASTTVYLTPSADAPVPLAVGLAALAWAAMRRNH